MLCFWLSSLNYKGASLYIVFHVQPSFERYRSLNVLKLSIIHNVMFLYCISEPFIDLKFHKRKIYGEA